MKRVIAYLLLMLGFYTAAGLAIAYDQVAFPSDSLRLLATCATIGGLGGVTYCLRAVYLNACVHKRWGNDWLPWYFIRPIVSLITGAVSCLFLQAGLIVFEASQTDSPTNLAFYALAFVAGLNVDKFIQKVEEIAEVTWGIKKSRTASDGSSNESD